MRIRPLLATLIAAALVSGSAQAGTDADESAASIGAKLDLGAFANSTGPRREPDKKTPADYGFAPTTVAQGWASFVNPAIGWRLGVKVLERSPEGVVICFRDEARNGGSYDTQTALSLRPAPDGLYRAIEAPPRPADCPARR